MAIVSQSIDESGASAGKPPVFAKAPVRSPAMAVEPQWIDYNGHMNVAYYQVFFDRAIDGLFTLLGLGPKYLIETNNSMFALEAHISYLREIKAGDRVFVDSQILDHDRKRIHLFQTLVHADDGFVSATGEIMQLHVSMATRRSAPFPADRMALIAACAAAHAGLPRPERAGRSIGLHQKKA
jgi:acyl-CoA thioester hydrolase